MRNIISTHHVDDLLLVVTCGLEEFCAVTGDVVFTHGLFLSFFLFSAYNGYHSLFALCHILC